MISPGRDKRIAILDVKGNKTERYDVYDYPSCMEYIVRDMTTLKHVSQYAWEMVIKQTWKTCFKYDKRTGKYMETNRNLSQKDKSTDNKNPDDWKPYAERLKEYLKQIKEGEE